MTQEGAILAVDAPELIRNLSVLLPVPVAIVDSGSRIVLANSQFNDLFPNTKSIQNMSHHEVRADGSIYDFDVMPLTDDGFSAFVGRETSAEGQLRGQLVHMEWTVGSYGKDGCHRASCLRCCA